MEPPVRPHSTLSQYQHIVTDVGTTDSTPLVSQIRATQTTACSTPPNPLLTDDNCVCRQPSPIQTSATPSVQSFTHSQCCSSDHYRTTAAVSEFPTHHQSRVVDNVLTQHTSRLTEVFSNDLQSFSNRFVELGFIRRKAASDIQSMVGIGSGGKGDKLLDLVMSNCHASCDEKEWFDRFIGVFSCEAAYEDLATSMTECFTRNCKYSGSYLSLDQSHSCTTDRPSLVVRCHVMPHSELQSVRTQSQASGHISSQMQCFIKYVKTFYKGYEVEGNPKVIKLPKLPTKIYINLVCIDRESVKSTREYDKVTEVMVREGSVDVVRGSKWPIDIDEIAANLPSTSLKKIILLEGAPGVGKSTFAWEFCRRWERGEIAQQYQLVLLLRLREDRISNAKSLEDLIYHPSKDVCYNVIKELEENLGVNALIILEGFDELPNICRTVPSVFLDLVSGELLPLATVMVTSRPWATRVLHDKCSHRIFQHIEILGFTDQQISSYIESVLSESYARDFETFLESHPQIRAGMYIPLNSAIVVTVYEESQASGYDMPTTLTELYTSLTQTLLRRYLHGHPEYESDARPLQKFNDLPSLVYTKFCELCKLAYSGVVSPTARYITSSYFPQIITTSDGTSDQVQLIFRDLPSDFDDLGFMDSVTELYVTRGAVSSHNFLHLTFQEFFSAVHISNMSPAQQVEHFKRHKEGRLKVVLRFLAGLNKLNCFSDLIVSDFFQAPSRHYNFFLTPSTREGSRYLMSCDAEVGIDLVQWLFEAQSDDIIERVLKQKTIEFDMSSGMFMSSGMLPLDYYCLGYCISHSQCQWVLQLGEEKIGKAEVKMLSAGAGNGSVPSGRVVELRGWWTRHTDLSDTPEWESQDCDWESQDWEWTSDDWEKSLDSERRAEISLSWQYLNMILIEWKSILHLHQLSLKLDRCDYLTCPENLSALRVLKLVVWNKIEWNLNALFSHLSLESLTIAPAGDGCGLVYEDCVDIADYVKYTTSLKELCISVTEGLYEESIMCISTNKGVKAITAALANNQSLPLERLELECKCTFTATAVDSLAQFITNTTTLQYLSIQRCTFCPHTLLVLARADNSILQTKQLKRLHLTVNGDTDAKEYEQLLVQYPHMVISTSCKEISDTGAVALAQVLQRNSTLAELDLSNNSISDAGAEVLAQAIHGNSTLTALHVSNSSISKEELAPGLHHNSTLKRLNLSNNHISDCGAKALAQALRHNSTLKRLNLSNNHISDCGAEALAQALHHNSTLKRLNLSNNSICGGGAEALAQALHHNSTLKRLNLFYNSISDAGAVALAQPLHHNSTLRWLHLSGNDGIGEEGTCKLVQALTVNTSISLCGGLCLPGRCKEYAMQCQQYHAVKDSVRLKNRLLFWM